MSEQIFDAQSVLDHLHTPNLQITVLPEVTSTNTILAQQAMQGAPEGTVLAAHRQSAGRGRIGRSFYSPACGGLYFTLLLRPSFKSAKSALLTPACAVAMADAIEKVCHISPKIKWVNDLYLHSRKICGILTEAMPDKSGKNLDYVLIGIGTNIYPAEQALPQELSQKAGTIFPAKTEIDYRPLILAAFLDNFFSLYPALNHEEIFPAYKDKLFILGSEVEVSFGADSYPAQVMDLNDDFSLRVRTKGGEYKNLFSGEISLKIL